MTSESRDENLRKSRMVFYENDGFQGRSFTADSPVDDFRRSG